VLKVFAAGAAGSWTPRDVRRGRIRAGDLIAELGLRGGCSSPTKVWTSGRDEGIRQWRSRSALKVQKMDSCRCTTWWMSRPTENPAGVETEAARALHRITHYTSSAYAEVERWLKTRQYDFLQINYSLGERAAEKKILPLARDLGVAVIVNRPFAEGALFRRVRGKPLPRSQRTWASRAGAIFSEVDRVPSRGDLRHSGTGKPEHMQDTSPPAAQAADEAQRRGMAQYFDSL